MPRERQQKRQGDSESREMFMLFFKYLGCMEAEQTRKKIDGYVTYVVQRSVITNYRTSFNGNQKRNLFLLQVQTVLGSNFLFKLFWAAIFSSMLFYRTQYVLSPFFGTRAAVSSIRCELWFSPSNVLSLSSTSDIWLNVHLHSYEILTFSIFCVGIGNFFLKLWLNG